ncbi:MAG: ACP S-malonyltransferase [Ardenticatenaceae bacterium]|nr:ACP S-malonyltransferase [Anaerolineales bacterium]MCB8939088.1 ACP S-malonyltransferase [Ardenticatenaceae bacterium]MCB8974844.1 ACP S-malonyltransferase [Ardenticatenaceae bacterium]
MSSAYLFPGQGAQHVGMGLELYQNTPEARAVFDQADEQLGIALSTLCFEGPEETLTDTVNQQPALFVTSMAMWQRMQAQGWELPAYVAGHSLGELSALTAVGALSFADGLSLVRKRGELMKAAGEQEPGAMAAILALDIPTVQQICEQASNDSGAVQVANDNCPGQVVISGDEDALMRAMTLAEEAKARKVVKLPITIAAHSRLMASAAEAFAQAVDATPIQAPSVPVIANVTAQPLTTPDQIREELKAQLTAGVSWTDSMNYLLAQDVDTFVEVGPGDTLLSFMKRIERKANRVKLTFGDNL